MKRIVHLAIGACALGAAALAAAPDASAQSWSSVIGPNNYTVWSNGSVSGAISTISNSSLFGTFPQNGSNAHQGGFFFQCTNEAFDGWPKGTQTWNNGDWREEHFCQSGNTISYSYGWVHDN